MNVNCSALNLEKKVFILPFFFSLSHSLCPQFPFSAVSSYSSCSCLSWRDSLPLKCRYLSVKPQKSVVSCHILWLKRCNLRDSGLIATQVQGLLLARVDHECQHLCDHEFCSIHFITNEWSHFSQRKLALCMRQPLSNVDIIRYDWGRTWQEGNLLNWIHRCSFPCKSMNP